MNKELLKKLLIIGGVFLGALIIFLIVASIIKGVTNKKNPYEKIKINASNAAEKYYDSLKEKLNSGESIEVTFDELVSKKYMKEYTSKLDDGVKCSGKVVISNNFDNMLYTSIMDCGKAYKDETLSEHILSDNVSVDENGNGLYDLYNRHVFRGEDVNNYLYFANRYWTILSINENGSVRAISNSAIGDPNVWDDRYNSDIDRNYGFNTYDTSRLKDRLNAIANGTELFNNEQKKYVKPHTICVGERSIYETNHDYSVECSKTVDNQMIGLLQVNEYLLPSLDSSCSLISDKQCTNYNYIYNMYSGTFMWTTTINSGTSYYAYLIDGLPEVYNTNVKANIFPVIELSPEVQYLSGDGTYNDPYTIAKS